jgi:hypothetical protein
VASGRNTHEFEVNLFDFFVKSQQKNRVFGKFPEILRSILWVGFFHGRAAAGWRIYPD